MSRLDVLREVSHLTGLGCLARTGIDTILILMISDAELQELVLVLVLSKMDCVRGPHMTLPLARLGKALGQSPRQAEVTELDPHVTADEDVARLDVSVHHVGSLEEV